jgi:hypothetical protein
MPNDGINQPYCSIAAIAIRVLHRYSPGPVAQSRQMDVPQG